MSAICPVSFWFDPKFGRRKVGVKKQVRLSRYVEEKSDSSPQLLSGAAGLGHEGIYRKNGAKSRIKLLMEEFRKDARNVKLRIGDHFIEDVTDVLKRFFREIDDPIFMADLHPLWQEAASEYLVLVLVLPVGASDLWTSCTDFSH